MSWPRLLPEVAFEASVADDVDDDAEVEPSDDKSLIMFCKSACSWPNILVLDEVELSKASEEDA